VVFGLKETRDHQRFKVPDDEQGCLDPDHLRQRPVHLLGYLLQEGTASWRTFRSSTRSRRRRRTTGLAPTLSLFAMPTPGGGSGDIALTLTATCTAHRGEPTRCR